MGQEVMTALNIHNNHLEAVIATLNFVQILFRGIYQVVCRVLLGPLQNPYKYLAGFFPLVQATCDGGNTGMLAVGVLKRTQNNKIPAKPLNFPQIDTVKDGHFPEISQSTNFAFNFYKNQFNEIESENSAILCEFERAAKKKC